MYFMYIIFNENESYYIGYTGNIEKRISSHNEGREKSAKGHVWKLV